MSGMPVIGVMMSLAPKSMTVGTISIMQASAILVQPLRFRKGSLGSKAKDCTLHGSVTALVKVLTAGPALTLCPPEMNCFSPWVTKFLPPQFQDHIYYLGSLLMSPVLPPFLPPPSAMGSPSHWPLDCLSAASVYGCHLTSYCHASRWRQCT